MTNQQHSFYKIYTNAHQKNTRQTFFSLFRKSFCVFLFIGSLILPTSATAYTFPVPIKLFDRIDWSSAEFPWVYAGPNTRVVDPIENTEGCAGTDANGVAVRVTCDDKKDVIGPAFLCTGDLDIRDIHVGESIVGSVKIIPRETSSTDGVNPDGCEINDLGETQIIVSVAKINELAGNIHNVRFIWEEASTGNPLTYWRWTCPKTSPLIFPVDIDGDGNAYDGYGFNSIGRKIRNPEACGIQECPSPEASLSHQPDNPKATSLYGILPGYVCEGSYPEKQPLSFCPTNPTAGNPIIIATGNKFQTEHDYQSLKPFGLSFTRFYNSNTSSLSSNIGKKWRHNYSRRIVVKAANAAIYRENGQVLYFNNPNFNNGGTLWQADADIASTLTETRDNDNNQTGWIYTTANDIDEVYNRTGQLLSITNRQGQKQSFIYNLSSATGGDDNSTTLDKITGFFGDTLSFSYDASHRITSMTDPQGQYTHYSYDETGNLSRVTYPDNTESFTDNPTRQYHYENTNYPNHLTGITDENNSRYVTWAYNEKGVAISSEHTKGVDKETVVYGYDDEATEEELDFLDDAFDSISTPISDWITVINPLNKRTTYFFTSIHGVQKVILVAGYPTANCTGANQAYTYDENGYLTSKTDWQGIKTTYLHNAKGLELSRTEAKGTPEARTITTQWHAKFRLPIKITEPGKITEYSYDEQGRLLSQSSRDTK